MGKLSDLYAGLTVSSDNDPMFFESLKRLLNQRPEAKRAEAVVLSQRPRGPELKPQVLWSRDNVRPGDLGSLGQELGRD